MISSLRLRGLLLIVLAVLSVACSRPSPPGPPDFADLVESVSPSVVNISTLSDFANERGVRAAPDSGANPFRDFFKDPSSESEGNDEPAEEGDSAEGMESLGSGLVLWEDGYILTNAHVVMEAREIVVRLSDRRELIAKLVGVDERSDLALLKIEADDLPAVKLGDASKLRAGQWVLAIGSPFGFDHSVTAGIVSAKGRALPSENYVPFIQTDVAINPGNSGGPLFNVAGEVVGINSQIFSQTGGYMGVSFSIPIDVAASVAQQLRDKGKVTRGWLGVVVQEVTRGLAQTFGMDKARGALVTRVLPKSPAAEAGVRAGDVILSFNGVELPTSSALPPLVGNIQPGDSVLLEIVREKQTISIKLEVGTLDSDDGERRPPLARDPLGIGVQALTAAERAKENIVSGGARVMTVGEGPGRAAGLRVGDLILTLNGNQIDSAERWAEVVDRLTSGASAPLLVQRNGAPLFLALEIPPR